MIRLVIIVNLIAIIFSCKPPKEKASDSQHTKKEQSFTEKKVLVYSKQEQKYSYTLRSINNNHSNIGVESNFSDDQVFIDSKQLLGLLENEAAAVFLSNSLHIKSKNTLEEYKGCKQFILMYELFDSQATADLILIALDRELVLKEEDEYGIICIEKDAIKIDFRSDAEIALMIAILEKIILPSQDKQLSLTLPGFKNLRKVGQAPQTRHIDPTTMTPKIIKKIPVSEIDRKASENAFGRIKRDEIGKDDIQGSIEELNYPQTVEFFRRFLADRDLRNGPNSQRIRDALESNLITEINNPKNPKFSAEPLVENGYIMKQNVRPYMEYLRDVYGLRQNYPDTSFRVHSSIREALDSLKDKRLNEGKNKQVMIVNAENDIHNYVVSVNHSQKTVTIADSVGNRQFETELRKTKLALQEQLGPDYEIHPLPIQTQFAPNHCTIFCSNFAAHLMKNEGDVFVADMFVLTQSASRLRSLDRVREFLESPQLKNAPDRLAAFDQHVDKLNYKGAKDDAISEAWDIANDPRVRGYLEDSSLDSIRTGKNLWSIERTLEQVIPKKADEWDDITQVSNAELRSISTDFALLELMRRKIADAAEADRHLFLWESYRGLATRLPDDANLRNRYFTIQSADGQVRSFSSYFSDLGDKQNLTAADQFSNFLLWMSAKANKPEANLRRLRVGSNN